MWFTFWIRLELISFKIEQNESTSDWLAHSDFKKNVEKRCVWGWISAKKKVKNMFTRSTAGENTFACVFNNMMMFEQCSQWCVARCYSFFYMFFQLIQIGPDRFRGFPDLTKRSQTVLKLTWTLDTSFQHLIRTHWRSTCPLQTRLLPKECLILTKYLWSEIKMGNDSHSL